MAAGDSQATYFALMGEWVTCENGHRVVQFRRDVRLGEEMDPATQYENWQIPEPIYGDLEPRCHCGGRFFWGSRVIDDLGVEGEHVQALCVMSGVRMHFQSGWRAAIEVTAREDYVPPLAAPSE